MATSGFDLANSVPDAIGSVARFLEQHGWQPGGTIAVPARVQAESPVESWLAAGIIWRYAPAIC